MDRLPHPKPHEQFPAPLLGVSGKERLYTCCFEHPSGFIGQKCAFDQDPLLGSSFRFQR